MPPKAPSRRRVAMAKRLARKWVEANAAAEYRMTVYRGAKEVRNLPGLLRSFRDGKIKIGSVAPITDLGLKTGFDQITIWSGDREGLIKLDSWLRQAGCETTGVW